jgi:hypothetical protein
LHNSTGRAADVSDERHKGAVNIDVVISESLKAIETNEQKS